MSAVTGSWPTTSRLGSGNCCTAEARLAMYVTGIDKGHRERAGRTAMDGNVDADELGYCQRVLGRVFNSDIAGDARNGLQIAETSCTEDGKHVRALGAITKRRGGADHDAPCHCVIERTALGKHIGQCATERVSSSSRVHRFDRWRGLMVHAGFLHDERTLRPKRDHGSRCGQQPSLIDDLIERGGD
ncbi:hypothetical protein GQR58_029823 [Nymphon striatum]|nr:hypothetical protein GQR58_029823 [Nymphon striatum]